MAAVSARLPATVIVPMELPGASVPPLMVVLPTVPLPPSVPPGPTVTAETSEPFTRSVPPVTLVTPV